MTTFKTRTPRIPRTIRIRRATQQTGMERSGADPRLRANLARRLQALRFPAFARCAADLLSAMGYEEVRPTGRGGYKGRNRDGGFDLEAKLPSPLGRPGASGGRKVVAQIKRYAPGERVYRRAVDELRGVCLRVGASEGLLITTGRVSGVALDSQAAIQQRDSTGSMPVMVHLIDGDALLDMLVRYRIGVREDAQSGVLQVDEVYFTGLDAGFPDDAGRREGAEGKGLGADLGGAIASPAGRASAIPPEKKACAEPSLASATITITFDTFDASQSSQSGLNNVPE